MLQTMLIILRSRNCVGICSVQLRKEESTWSFVIVRRSLCTTCLPTSIQCRRLTSSRLPNSLQLCSMGLDVWIPRKTEVSSSFAGMSLANIVSRPQESARMVRALKYLIGSSLTTDATKSSDTCRLDPLPNICTIIIVCLVAACLFYCYSV